MSLVRHPVATPKTSADDPRVGHLLGTALRDGDVARVTLVGFAVDQGVERNGGRVGAHEAPVALRERLYRLCPDAENVARFTDLLEHTRDLGDVESTGDLERDQATLGAIVGEALRAGSFVIVLGGGHETTFGHFLGYVAARREVAIHNVDAHADVRPLKHGLGHSGSPFRQALEHPSGTCKGYRVEALQASAVAASHVAYLRERGARYGFRERFDAETLFDAPHATLATFCLDAVDQAFAPGVSAPSTGGLNVSEWLRSAYRAGASTSVTSADVVELNPRFDVDGQTARLAARTVWELLRGLATRPQR